MTEKGSKLVDQVRYLAELTINAPKKLSPKMMNEEWTKEHLIVPLLKALGWNDPCEFLPEAKTNYIEDRIDYLLTPEPPDSANGFQN